MMCNCDSNTHMVETSVSFICSWCGEIVLMKDLELPTQGYARADDPNSAQEAAIKVKLAKRAKRVVKVLREAYQDGVSEWTRNDVCRMMEEPHNNVTSAITGLGETGWLQKTGRRDFQPDPESGQHNELWTFTNQAKGQLGLIGS